MHSDLQFQYACGTGIFMALESEFPARTFSPCDTILMPGACYRFKNRLFSSVLKNVTDICSTQCDEYHTIGCIWGNSYVDHGKAISYFSRCEQYLPKNNLHKERDEVRHAACIDGIFSALEINVFPDVLKEKVCDDLADYPLSYDICMKRKNRSFQIFTFDEDDDFYYNVKILENDYDPENEACSPSIWLEEWNNITPVPLAPQNQDVSGEIRELMQHNHNH